MSDGISKMHEEYDEYVKLCKILKEEPTQLYADGWYGHYMDLKKKIEYDSVAKSRLDASEATNESLINGLENAKVTIVIIESELQNRAVDKNKNLIGKYFKLASTCAFRVDKIDEVDGDSVHCIGCKVIGGVGFANGFELKPHDHATIDTSVKLQEITESEFFMYIHDSFEYNKNKCKK